MLQDNDIVEEETQHADTERPELFTSGVVSRLYGIA